MLALRRILLAAALAATAIGINAPSASAHTSACVGAGTIWFDESGSFTISIPNVCVGGGFTAYGWPIVGFCGSLQLVQGIANGHHAFTATMSPNGISFSGGVQGQLDFIKGLSCAAPATTVAGAVAIII